MDVTDSVKQAFDAVQLPSLQRETLAIRVATILKRHIMSEGLEPGTALPPERRLADALSVSRTVLREALSQLIGEGLIERRSARALCVAPFDRDRLTAELASGGAAEAETRDLIELRVIIEIGAIEAIVYRATDEHLREIERWVVDGEHRVAADQAIALADARFHAALLRTLGNETINAMLPLIEENLRQNLITDAHHLHKTGTPDDHRVVSEHRQIFEAIKRRDVDGARLLMLAHLNRYLIHRAPAPVLAAPPFGMARLHSDGAERADQVRHEP